MRVSTLLLALPVLATAQQNSFLDQVKGWLGMAGEAIPAAVTSVINPLATKAARNFEKRKVDPLEIEHITLENHKRLLIPTEPKEERYFQEWIVLVTGGNKTCYGMCGKAEEAFNNSVSSFAFTFRPLHLGLLNCETEGVLCNAWAVNVPSVLYMFMPHPMMDESPTPDSIVRHIPVNRTTVGRLDLVSLHTMNNFALTQPYEGYFHPFNGPLAKFGLLIPFGYLLWGFSRIPSWAFMVAISFISRSFMGRRMEGRQRAAPGQAPAAGQPAAQ